MNTQISRRQFIRNAIYGAGAVVSTGVVGSLTGCSGEGLVEGSFDHGVASGDPLADRVILWTRVTPNDPLDLRVRVFWEVATDKQFRRIVRVGSALTSEEHDYTLKVDAVGLQPNQTYYYRFSTINTHSRIGTTKTLPVGDVSQVKLLALSCAAYPAGYFHVYAEAAKQDVDVAIHLGDYIYEHERGGYASEDAQALGREVLPEGELLTLSDYRTRYAQYRTDTDLQDFHATLPIIAVWDDHEVANDAWREGAENHDETTEGLYWDRLIAALKAYSEWMPIRPDVDRDVSSLYRNFQFGDLLNLIMLDTRIVGRDKPLDIESYVQPDGTFDMARYTNEVYDPNRTMLGQTQLGWLKEQLSVETRWSLLGQQVLMGEMALPGAIATRQLSVAQFAELAGIAQLAATDPASLTLEQQAFLTDKGHLLSLPNLPYNLDAWDGYPLEREEILMHVDFNGTKLVVLAGDTHNAWANNLPLSSTGSMTGVEFATASVTSPGIEAVFGLETPEQIIGTEMGVIQLIDNLKYTNLADRGFLTLTITPEQVSADWTFVSTIKEPHYVVQEDRGHHISVSVEQVEIVG